MKDGIGIGLNTDVFLLRKRPGHKTNGVDRIASIPNELYQIWIPLLNHLASSIDNFADVLQEALINTITHPTSSMGKSFLHTSASWLLALFGDDKPVLAAPKMLSRHQLFSELSREDEGLERDRPTILLARRCLTSPTIM